MKKSAATSGRPELEREQPSMKVVTVSFCVCGGGGGTGWFFVGGGGGGEHKPKFLGVIGFSVMSRKIARKAFSLV